MKVREYQMNVLIGTYFQGHLNDMSRSGWTIEAINYIGKTPEGDDSFHVVSSKPAEDKEQHYSGPHSMPRI